MRLSPREVAIVRQVLHAADPDGRAYLFGSRADDSKRGGDIDIYFESSKTIDLKTALAVEYRLASLCRTKVDLTIKNPGQAEQPIHGIARKGIPL